MKLLKQRWMVFLAFLGVLTATQSVRGFVSYDVSLLGWGTPCGMNERGDVVGGGRAGIWGSTPVLWRAGHRTPLALVPGTRGSAQDINESGAIIASGLSLYSALWVDGTVTDLGSWGAKAVNNLMQVVLDGGIWENGSTRSIGGISGSDINDRGQVAGNLYGTGAVIWDAGTVTAVGPPSVLRSRAYGINESGQIVGQADMPDRYGRGFFWDGIESVILAALGAGHASAQAINDLVQIVGWSDTPDGDRHAVLWEDGAIADLNDLLTEPFPYTLVEAVDINNRGQIACRAVGASGGSWAVLLTPIPEPGTILLLAAGAALAGRRRRRR